jgi:predicted nucleotidyltransferase
MMKNKEVLENKNILTLKKMIIDFFKYDKVKIVLFGSRARGDNYVFSDVDIGIMPYGKLDRGKITLLREKIENLNIPYRVEIVSFMEVSKEFKQEALKGSPKRGGDMERLKIKHNDALRSLKTLGEILKEPFSMIVRDATIQRFECTFEAIWKFLKEYLREKEGIISNSPKRCFKEIFPLGFLTEEPSSFIAKYRNTIL